MSNHRTYEHEDKTYSVESIGKGELLIRPVQPIENFLYESVSITAIGSDAGDALFRVVATKKNNKSKVLGSRNELTKALDWACVHLSSHTIVGVGRKKRKEVGRYKAIMAIQNWMAAGNLSAPPASGQPDNKTLASNVISLFGRRKKRR